MPTPPATALWLDHVDPDALLALVRHFDPTPTGDPEHFPYRVVQTAREALYLPEAIQALHAGDRVLVRSVLTPEQYVQLAAHGEYIDTGIDPQRGVCDFHDALHDPRGVWLRWQMYRRGLGAGRPVWGWAQARTTQLALDMGARPGAIVTYAVNPAQVMLVDDLALGLEVDSWIREEPIGIQWWLQSPEALRETLEDFHGVLLDHENAAEYVLALTRCIRAEEVIDAAIYPAPISGDYHLDELMDWA